MHQKLGLKMRSFVRRLPGVSQLLRRLGEIDYKLERSRQNWAGQLERTGQIEARVEALSASLQSRVEALSASLQSIEPILTGVRIRAKEAEVQLEQVGSRIDKASQEFLAFSCNELPQIIGFRFDEMQKMVLPGLEQIPRLVAEAVNEEVSHIKEVVDAKIAKASEAKEAALPLEHSRLVSEWVREEWRCLRPLTAVGVPLIRVGRAGDGGYVMADDLSKTSHGISIGVGSEISWDLEMAERGIKMALFDHTIDRIPTEHSNIQFHAVGLGGADNCPNLRTISGIIRSLDLSASTKVVLKIDVEGHEWSALANLEPDVLNSFSQILIEFHGLSDFSDFDRHCRRLFVLRSLSSSHQVVHLHANNWGSYRIVGGMPVPDVVEATWLRRGDYSFSAFGRATTLCKLDFPNNANRAEIDIGIDVLCGDR